MLTIDISQFNTYVTALLPMIVACLAGVIRQDRLPSWVNEVITILFILLAACIQAFGDGKLGGSPFADFAIVAGYTSAVLHTPLVQKLQGAIQANILAIGKPKPPAPPMSIEQFMAQMNAQTRQSFVQQQMPQQSVYNPGATSIPIADYPTQTNMPTMPQVVRTSTPMPPTQGG